jgi:hypothetical protein
VKVITKLLIEGQEPVITIRTELIDELLAGRNPASVMRQDGRWTS